MGSGSRVRGSGLRVYVEGERVGRPRDGRPRERKVPGSGSSRTGSSSGTFFAVVPLTINLTIKPRVEDRAEGGVGGGEPVARDAQGRRSVQGGYAYGRGGGVDVLDEGDRVFV